MPTYEYACKSCGSHLEVVQKFTDDALTECPSCEGPLRKVFGNIGITFKGDGFYKTDSRSSSSSKAKVKGESSDKGSDGSSDTKTETKGDTKSETKGDTKSDTSSKEKPKETKKADTPKAAAS